jgi:hypothetical protein
MGEMNNTYEEDIKRYSDDIKEIIKIKLETTRAICNNITDSNLTNLSEAAKLEFADVIELIAILMLEHAGEFPEEWTSEKLVDIYHFKLPTLLEPEERQNIKVIIMTYVQFVGEALELPNYLEIKKELAS